MFDGPLVVGDVTVYQWAIYKIVDIDRYGYCTLVDIEGKTTIEHEESLCHEVFLRAWATKVWDDRSK